MEGGAEGEDGAVGDGGDSVGDCGEEFRGVLAEGDEFVGGWVEGYEAAEGLDEVGALDVVEVGGGGGGGGG